MTITKHTLDATMVVDPYWTNVAGWTPGTVRTNLCLNPRAGLTTGWAQQMGTSEVAPLTRITGAPDGPLPGVATYYRKSVTTAKTGGSSGIFERDAASLSGVIGDVLTASIYVRPSVSMSMRCQVTPRLAGAASGAAANPAYVMCPANVWTRLSATMTTTAAYDSVQVWANENTNVLPIGATSDATCVLIEQAASLGDYLDGDMPDSPTADYAWTGTANASTSTMTPLIQHDADTPIFADGFQGTVQWTANEGTTTVTRTFNDLTQRFELSMVFNDGGFPLAGSANKTGTVATVVGRTYRIVTHGYSSDANTVAWVDVTPGSPTHDNNPLVTGVQEFTTVFTATSTATTLILHANTYSGAGVVTITDVALYEIASSTYLDLKPERATVRLDEAWSPYVSATLTCPLPPKDILDKIDPRKSTRVALTMTQADHDSLKASDFTAMLQATGITRTNLATTPRTGNWTSSAIVGGSDAWDQQPLAYGPGGLAGGQRNVCLVSASDVFRYDFPVTIAAGNYVQGSVYVRSSSPMTISLALVSGGSTIGPSIALPANIWTRVDLTRQVPTVQTMMRFQITTSAVPIDTRFDITQVLIEKVSGASVPVGDFFDGDVGRVGNPAGFPRWTGTPNASASARTYGAVLAAGLTVLMAGRTAAHLTDLFGDQYNPGFDPTLNLSRTLNLGLRTRALDYVAGTMTLTLTSDEMLLQDYARPSLATQFAPPVTTSLKALVTWALALANLGSLDPSSSDFTITSTDAIWNQGEDLWGFLGAFISNAGLRLWADEKRSWYLKPAFDGSAGRVAISGLTSLDDVLSRDGWGDAVLIENEWTDPGTGLTATQYAGATSSNFSRTVVQKNVSKAAPTSGGAAALLARVRGRGRNVSVQGVSNYAVSPGLTANISTPATTIQPVIVSSVSWAWPEDEMTVTTRDLP